MMLDRVALNRIILEDQYPRATDAQLDKGAQWRSRIDETDKYDYNPELFRHDLEMVMFGKAEPVHQHMVNEHSVMKFNGGNPVYLCGHDNGRCRVIVCYADYDPVTKDWTPGKPLP